jgi:acetyl esterase/lipase
MAAYLGSYGPAEYGGDDLSRPGAVIMAYTGHTDYTENDPPTFVVVSENDPIASAVIMGRRVNALRKAGIDVELRKYRTAGHGFGLGMGTDAEGWIEYAVKFWEKHMK